MEKIREAEAKASVIRAEAEKEARRRIEQAEKDGAAEAARVVDAASAEWKQRLEEVRGKTDALIVQSRTAAEGELADMEAQVRLRTPEAKRLITGEMFKACR